MGKQSPQHVGIDVLGHKMLQPKRSVFVIKVEHKTLVVGVTEDGMRTLAELPEQAPLRPKNARNRKSVVEELTTDVSTAIQGKSMIPFTEYFKQHSRSVNAAGRQNDGSSFKKILLAIFSR